MPQYAGQMLNTGNVNATGPLWIPANGANFDRFTGGQGGGYFARIGWRSGMVGIGRFRIPSSPGWLVLIDDNPAGATLPPDTPTAADPPTGAAGSITIAAVTGAPAGAIPVSGTVAPSGTPVRVYQMNGGVVVGGPTAMTVTGTTWSGSQVCTAGSRQIQAQLTNATFIYQNSNTFTVT